MNRLRVLFVCVHNSARSQMAEAFMNALGAGRFEAESAGLEPTALNPVVVEVMREVGLDLAQHTPRAVFDLYKQGRTYDYVITVCDASRAQRCPLFPGKVRRLHWSFEDPAAFSGTADEVRARTRKVRDMIRETVAAFVHSSAAPAWRE
jgi:arsenate reductase